ncbi:S-layer domain-containing protein [Caldicellulosiruptor kronotskyensis 2002]|uniref:S-layer domain-containing protein n=1 Tax=Caldicellulosiruptor kronotskyensis (strain DSM 18902 / VKM B-2412 / 2002) TaxID=632348 RepID=E4SCF1_CALK2|nr:S-layer homology domain-containing protein [Caldicellulosiruptor kronotskyensis]ADQ45006.1 S-layer domain-containing protein [Caldicellulosiruptor kronotskyensis 2002]
MVKRLWILSLIVILLLSSFSVAFADIRVETPYMEYQGDTLKFYSTVESDIYGELSIGDEVLVAVYAIKEDGNSILLGQGKIVILDVYQDQTDGKVYYNGSNYNLIETSIPVLSALLTNSSKIKFYAASLNKISNTSNSSYSIFALPPIILPNPASVDKTTLGNSDLELSMYLPASVQISKIIKSATQTELRKDIDYVISNSKLYFKNAYVKNLSLGQNTFEIYDTLGNITILKVNVTESAQVPSNQQGSTPSQSSGSAATNAGSNQQGTFQQSSAEDKSKLESTIQISVDKNLNTANAVIDKDTISKLLLSQKVEETKKLILNVKAEGNISTYNMNLPKDTLQVLSDKVESLKITTPVCSLELNKMLLQDIKDKEVSVKVSNKTENIAESVKQILGQKPIVSVQITAGDAKLESLGKSAVKLEIPYKPSAIEKENTHKLVGVRIDGDNIVTLKQSFYSAQDGHFVIFTDHLSDFSLLYRDVSFDDAFYSYAKKQIEFLAARDVIKGVGKNKFMPKNNITRADFVTLIVRAFGLDARVDSNFDDVLPSDYYYQTVGIAKKLGIVNGVGKNKFEPKKAISREDVMCIMERTLKLLGLLEVQEEPTKVLDQYSDSNQISDYAKDAIAQLVKNQIVKGYNNMLNPKRNLTREEAAVLLYNIYQNVLLR